MNTTNDNNYVQILKDKDAIEHKIRDSKSDPIHEFADTAINFGKDCTAGCRGFYYSEYTRTTGKDNEFTLKLVTDTSGTSADLSRITTEVSDFDNTKVYSKYELCRYSGKVYQCISSSYEAGEWNPSNWAEGVEFSMKADYSANFLGRIISVTGNLVTCTAKSYILSRGNWEPDQHYYDSTEPHYFWVPSISDLGTVPFGRGAFAVGEDNHANELGSFAIGRGNQVDGRYSVGAGYNNKVGYSSLAVGVDNTGDGLNQLIVGNGNISHSNHTIQAGSKNTIEESAQSSAAFGTENKINGSAHNSAAFGYQNIVSEKFSSAMGWGTTAEGVSSFSQNGINTSKKGETPQENKTVYYGAYDSTKTYYKNNMCSDTDGHIFMCRKGSKGVALPTSGDKYINDSWVLVAAAVGYSSNSSGISAAVGTSSHSEGQGSYTNSSQGSHVEGYFCIDKSAGASNHIEGANSTLSSQQDAAPKYVHIEGAGHDVTNASDAAHIQGKYASKYDGYADVIGYGSISSRKNISSLTTSGDLHIKKDIYINSNDDGTGGTKLEYQDLSPYLKTADAQETYLTKTDASDIYLKKQDAINDYVKKSSPSSFDVLCGEEQSQYAKLSFGNDKIIYKTSATENESELATVDNIPNVFVAAVGTTTYQEVTGALEAGKTILAKDNNRVYTYSGKFKNSHYFSGLGTGTSNMKYSRKLSDSNQWSTEIVSNFLRFKEYNVNTSWQLDKGTSTLTDDDEYIATSKAIKHYVDNRVVANPSSESTQTLSKLNIGGTIYSVSGGSSSQLYLHHVLLQNDYDNIEITLISSRQTMFESVDDILNQFAGTKYIVAASGELLYEGDPWVCNSVTIDGAAVSITANVYKQSIDIGELQPGSAYDLQKTEVITDSFIVTDSVSLL